MAACNTVSGSEYPASVPVDHKVSLRMGAIKQLILPILISTSPQNALVFVCITEVR